MKDGDNKEYRDLLFGIRRSIRYHAKRQAFYEGWERWTTFLTLLLGSGTVALAVQKSSIGAAVVGFAVSVISGAKLVWAFGIKAGKHSQFVRDFTRLEKELRGDTSKETVLKVTHERLTIEADEPPQRQALSVLCHNELAQAMGSSREEMYKVNPFRRLTANYYNWQGKQWEQISDPG